jgi:hypothetical protein
MARATPKRSPRAVKRKSLPEGNVKAISSTDAASEQAAPPVAPRIPVAESVPARVLPVFGPWRAADGAVVGTAHLRATPPKPCQDAALAEGPERALAILADGAGSAAVSHLGASAVVTGVRRLCRTIERDLAATLDTEDARVGLAERLAHRIVSHAKGLLDDLAEAHLRSSDDFRCTLLVWLTGRQRALWVKVGDGALVVEREGACYSVGPAGKGEFANQTCFISPRLEDRQWAWGEIDASDLSGLAAMSDGAAERLVSSDASRVSPAMGKLLRGVAEAQVGRREIFGLLAEADFWKGTSGDDKSLALVARGLAVA